MHHHMVQNAPQSPESLCICYYWYDECHLVALASLILLTCLPLVCLWPCPSSTLCYLLQCLGPSQLFFSLDIFFLIRRLIANVYSKSKKLKKSESPSNDAADIQGTKTFGRASQVRKRRRADCREVCAGDDQHTGNRLTSSEGDV